MIIVGNTLVSEDLFDQHFVCDLNACKGACCIEGESGAPLEQEELLRIDENLDAVKPFMRPEGIKAMEENGPYVVDEDGEFVTSLVGKHGECVFVNFDEKGIAKCALEQAFNAGVTNWKKPISCHLYPIRITAYPEFEVLHYDRWHICHSACSLGQELKVPVYQFLKEPLIRKYGQQWFDDLQEKVNTSI